MRLVECALVWCMIAAAADPLRTAWIISASGSGGRSPSLPDVHSISAGEEFVTVRSAGLSLKYFGPLQPPPVPANGLRQFVFELPLHPRPATGQHPRVPTDVIGAFVNGLPIYNHFEALSWNGANLWHYDAVALNDNGALTAAGRPRTELTHPAPAGLLEQLIESGPKHSPLIGFALDGYPVYGPWADGKRMRSSYRLRSITRRETWPDGTQLMPEQYGPDVGPADPLGTFVEDYEYAAGSGDLDRYNGRFAKTPEYPEGIYAYFMTTGATGKLAYPYLIGPRFYGHLAEAAAHPWYPVGNKRIQLLSNQPHAEAGRPVHFRLQARDADGETIRSFEYVHERPIHFVIASADLTEFAHIHPQLTADDAYEVSYVFPRGGAYRIWADYSLPGEGPHIDAFDINVKGGERLPDQPARSPSLRLIPAKALRAGEDIPIALEFTSSLDALEPYLGAWAHVIVIGEHFSSFAHAHPTETATAPGMIHTHIQAGPPPGEVDIVTNFPTAGMYKLWAQYQQAGEVITVPFVLHVAGAAQPKHAVTGIPEDAVRIRVTQHGYDPARIEIPADQPVTLAFTRDETPNCGAEVVFPSLGVRQALPLSATVLIKLPAQSAGEIAFSCGMGMFRGMVVATKKP